MLSFKEIKELITLVSEKGLAGIEIERSGFRLRIEGTRAGSNGMGFTPVSRAAPERLIPAAGDSPAPLPAPALGPGPPAPSVEEGEQYHLITSPIVGTFYRAPSPEAEPFVKAGDRVERGKVLCIIEAMKLMNEIESDVAGEIVRIYPQNGQPVEYGEKLFAIKLA